MCMWMRLMTDANESGLKDFYLEKYSNCHPLLSAIYLFLNVDMKTSSLWPLTPTVNKFISSCIVSYSLTVLNAKVVRHVLMAWPQMPGNVSLIKRTACNNLWFCNLVNSWQHKSLRQRGVQILSQGVRYLIHFVFAPGDPSLTSKFAIFFPAPNRCCEEGGSKKAMRYRVSWVSWYFWMILWQSFCTM